MARIIRAAILMACFFSAGSAFAAGGTCPSGANYLSPTNPAGALVTLSSLGVTNCYYISAAGSDSSYDGTTETVSGSHGPWLHAPGMPNCASNCRTAWNATIPAGTGIILRGGDTWHFGITTDSGGNPASGGMWNINSTPYPEGTSTHPIYIGVDPTWYSGGAWARPILTADNPTCSVTSCSGGSCTVSGGYLDCYVSSCAYTIASGNTFINTGGSSYFIYDNFEMTGLCQNDNGAPFGADVYFSYGSSVGTVFQNLYIHGWSHIQWYNVNSPTVCGGTGTCFNTFVFSGGTVGAPGETITHVIVDGNDSDPRGGGLCYCGFWNVSYSYFTHVSQIIYTNLHSFHDNVQDYFPDNGHANILEASAENGSGTANVIYNNVGTRWSPPIASTGEVGWWLLPPSGTTDYVFNNIQNSTTGLEQDNIGSNGHTVGDYVYFNNTLETDVSQGIASCTYLVGGTFTNANNFFIDATTPIGGCTPTTVTQLLLSNSTATTDGYTNSQTYWYSPTLGSSPTVGAGTNEQSYCTTMLGSSDPLIAAAGTACKSDTTYACSYNSTAHTLSCPARTVVARPTAGAWDVGAYQYSVAAAAPNPPTNLTAIVN